MALNCPKCSAELSLWSRKKNPYACPSCGTKIVVKSHEGPRLVAFVLWCLASVPLYFIPGIVHFPGAIIRVAIEVLVAVPIMLILFNRFSSASIFVDGKHPDTSEKN